MKLGTRILARVEGEDFVGRAAELQMLARHASVRDGSPLALLSKPQSGSSELLKQTYDRLFLFQDDVIPFYFAVSGADKTAENCARRFALQLAAQAVSFRKRNSDIQFAVRDIDELALLASPKDAAWIGRLALDLSGGDRDVESLLRGFARAAVGDARILPLIDDLHELQLLERGGAFFSALSKALEQFPHPSVLCGHRRFLFPKTSFQIAYIDRLGHEDFCDLIESMAHRAGVSVSEHCRDLMAVVFDRNADYLAHILNRARAKRVSLERFKDFEALYTDEIFDGAIRRDFENLLSALLPDRTARLGLMEPLAAAYNSGKPAALKQSRASRYLNTSEIASLIGNKLHRINRNTVIADLLAPETRQAVPGATRAKNIADSRMRFAARSPQLMKEHYRRRTSIGVREVLEAFEGQAVPSSLIDYGVYKRDLKGSREIDLNSLGQDEKIALPEIVFSAHGEHFYPQISEIISTERVAVGLGFSGDDKTVLIAAEIDSKLEVARELAEFWCDRLEMIGVATGFKKFRFWLISPEGFDDEALSILDERHAFGSSRKQIELLREFIGISEERSANGERFELVIPMSDDTEIVAAHTLETIAERCGFSSKSINQMKTALVEACINANEHSLSPDKKISIVFVFADDRMTITVTNRGVRLADRPTDPEHAKRRGWGLKLIEGLMDVVTSDQTDDGTRLVMQKVLG